MVGHRDEGGRLVAGAHAAVAAVERVDAQPGGDRAVIADLGADLLEGLEPEAGPVLEAAAVLVGAAVVAAHQKDHRQRDELRPHHIHDVEAGMPGPPGGGDVLTLDAPDVVAIHLK